MNGIPSPRSLDREIFVVEWTLQLPDRRSVIVEYLSGKTNISQEGGNNVR